MADSSNTNATSWFMQGDDGTVYGPVDTATLQAWCLEGRIEPGNALSQDRETWMDACEVEALEMDWCAQLDDGSRCGPFNLQLVPGLIENGVIPADAMLENRHTGETRPAITRAIADDQIPDGNDNTEQQDAEPSGEPCSPDAEASVNTEEADVSDALDAPLADDDQDEELPLSKRLEPLQRSATEARQQLVETRQALQALRTAHTVLQDENQRMQDELAVAITFRQKGEQQLLEQQDRAAAAETDVENLKAQLEQIKDHYDRLQLENQNQFEKIDALQATQLRSEQHFKRELSALRDRADAKTELLAGTVQLLMRDSDLAGRLKSVPVAAGADHDTESLKAAIKQLEQQLEYERRQARLQPPEAARGSRRNPFGALLLLFVAGALLGAVLISIFLKGCTRPAGKVAPDTTAAAAVAAPAATDEREFLLESAGPLDLQPEHRLLPEAPAEPAREGTALAIQWPAISLPAATIRQENQTLRIVFNEGIFSVATRLTPAAENALRSLAEQLQGKLNGHQLMIEGHTDATPIISEGSRYVDNFALGMARAEAVKAFLEQTGRLPAAAMRTSSAGESAPPFPNDSEADRKRNRTAVLTLVAHATG